MVNGLTKLICQQFHSSEYFKEKSKVTNTLCVTNGTFKLDQ
jgi:hypothetical protein